MKYPRPKYGDPSVPTLTHTALFGMGTRTLPVLEKPISIRENFRRAWTRQDPVWVPNSMTDTYGSILPMLNGTSWLLCACCARRAISTSKTGLLT